MLDTFNTRKVGEVVAAGVLILSLALGVAACRASDDDHKGYDPNMDVNSMAPPAPSAPEQGDVN